MGARPLFALSVVGFPSRRLPLRVLERILAGISMARKDDAGRLERASAVFDDLHESFRRKAR